MTTGTMGRRFQFFNSAKTYPRKKEKFEGQQYDVWEWHIYYPSIFISASLEDCVTLNTYLAVSSPINFNVDQIRAGYDRTYRGQQLTQFNPRTTVGNTNFKVVFKHGATEEEYKDFLNYCNAHEIKTW